MKNRNLALFDFDGTITTKDTLVEFIKYAVGSKNYYLGLLKLSPMLLAYMLKFIPNHKAKEQLIAYFFKDWESQKFQAIAKKYALEEIDTITRPQAIEQIRSHQEKGDKVVIVSASIECWIDAWAKQYGIELIATRLEHQDNRVTGKFATKNCYGIEKVNRIKKSLRLKEYQTITAYGDSSGDKEMLALSHNAYYKPFRG